VEEIAPTTPQTGTHRKVPAAQTATSRRTTLPRTLKFLSWRLWQHIAATLSYPLFVLGSLIMLLLVPLSMLLFRTRRQRTRWLRSALHRGARLWVGLTELLQLIRVEVDDQRASGPKAETISDTSTPLLIIANHPSLIDVLLVSAALPNLCCVLKGNLHYNPLFTLLIRHLDYLPNSDPELMLTEGQARLAAGEHLLIFPEGTRTTPMATTTEVPSSARLDLQFRLGAAELARRTGANTLPVVIHYHERYLSKGHPWYRLPRNIMAYRLEIGPTIDPPSAPARQATTRSSQKQHRRLINQGWITHFVERLSGPGMGN